ncbi:hypothetical protein GCM10025795_53390 [Verticiella sediminum]
MVAVALGAYYGTLALAVAASAAVFGLAWPVCPIAPGPAMLR